MPTLVARLCALAFALVLAASVLATPVPAVHDIHMTSLDLYALEGESVFAINVERVDKIVDLNDEQERALAASATGGLDVQGGTLLAARVARIIVKFKVSPQGQVSIDNKPVPYGMSDVRVEADVQTVVSRNGEKRSKNELVKAWDRGLVGMRVLLESNKTPDGVLHLTISEMVTEVNGKDVVQRNVLQQLIDVNTDGTLASRKPCHASAEVAERLAAGKMDGSHGHHGGHHGRKSCLGRKISAWFSSLTAPAKVLFATVLGMALGVLASALTRIFVLVFRKEQSTVALYEVHDESAPFITKVAMEEDKLPVYNSEGYVQVATCEKKESL